MNTASKGTDRTTSFASMSSVATRHRPRPSGACLTLILKVSAKPQRLHFAARLPALLDTSLHPCMRHVTRRAAPGPAPRRETSHCSTSGGPALARTRVREGRATRAAPASICATQCDGCRAAAVAPSDCRAGALRTGRSVSCVGQASGSRSLHPGHSSSTNTPVESWVAGPLTGTICQQNRAAIQNEAHQLLQAGQGFQGAQIDGHGFPTITLFCRLSNRNSCAIIAEGPINFQASSTC